MGKIVFSPNSRKPFIHAAFVSGPGHHGLQEALPDNMIPNTGSSQALELMAKIAINKQERSYASLCH